MDFNIGFRIYILISMIFTKNWTWFMNVNKKRTQCEPAIFDDENLLFCARV